MPTIKFYFDPLIAPDHSVVRAGRTPPDRYFLFDQTTVDFVPHWSGAVLFDIPRVVYPTDRRRVVPNYATVTENGLTYCYFVEDPNAIDPATVRVSLRIDWWGTYGDRLRVRGSQTRGGNSGLYAVPARYDEKTPALAAHAIGEATFGDGIPASKRFCVVSVLQCYLNNSWGQPDGEPFQVTVISRNGFTGDELAGYGDLTPRSEAAIAERPAFFGVGFDVDSSPLSYTVIAILRQQYVPYDMIFSSDLSNNFFDRLYSGIWYQLAVKAETPSTGHEYDKIDVFAISTRGDIHPKDALGTLSRRYDVRSRTDAEPTNNAGRRLFLGNIHTRVPVKDERLVASQAPTSFAVIRLTLTFNTGMLIELDDGDKLTDISALFDAGVAFNNENEMAYNAGDAKTLGAISSGISVAGQAIAGGAMVASGNPMGLLGIAGAAANAANIVANSQYRGRDVVIGGQTTSRADALKYGAVFDLIEVNAENESERALDAFLHGYVYEDERDVLDYSMTSILTPAASSLSTAVAFRSADVFPADAGEFGENLGDMLPTPDRNTLNEAANDLVRGVLIIADSVDSLQTAYNARTW